MSLELMSPERRAKAEARNEALKRIWAAERARIDAVVQQARTLHGLIYHEGYEARVTGVLYTDNPYADGGGPRDYAWRCGWSGAKSAADKRETVTPPRQTWRLCPRCGGRGERRHSFGTCPDCWGLGTI